MGRLTRGMCGMHYQRLMAHGDPLRMRPVMVGVAVCEIADCTSVLKARNWCSKHYTRWLRYGDPTARMPGEIVDGKRICPRCSEDLPLSQYSPRGRTCRACVARIKRDKERLNPPPPIVTHTAVCEYCGREFGANRKKRLHCSKQCAEANRYRRRAIYAQARRALVRARVEDFDRAEVFARDGWMCQLCDRPVDPSIEYPDAMSVSLDHVIPLSRGGEHSRANTQCSHLGCNNRKRARMPE